VPPRRHARNPLQGTPPAAVIGEVPPPTNTHL
jgi:hypothetical protein